MHAEGKEEVYARPSATYRHGKLCLVMLRSTTLPLQRQ